MTELRSRKHSTVWWDRNGSPDRNGFLKRYALAVLCGACCTLNGARQYRASELGRGFIGLQLRGEGCQRDGCPAVRCGELGLRGC